MKLLLKPCRNSVREKINLVLIPILAVIFNAHLRYYNPQEKDILIKCQKELESKNSIPINCNELWI